METLLQSRSHLRDKENDTERLKRVSTVLVEVIEHIEDERSGLCARYASEQERANSLLFTLEARGPDPYLASLLSTVEAAMTYCDRRTLQLERLSSLLKRSRRELTARQEHYSE